MLAFEIFLFVLIEKFIMSFYQRNIHQIFNYFEYKNNIGNIENYVKKWLSYLKSKNM